MTTPTPGQPLSEAEVSLLQPGDQLVSRTGKAGTFLAALHGRIAVEIKSTVLNGCTITDTYFPDYWSFVSRPHAPVSRPGDGVENEAYEIGKREGYAEAVADVDRLTGGDGEYRFCTEGDPDRHMPSPAAMKKKIAERFAALTPPAEPVSRPAGEGESVARIIDPETFDLIAHYCGIERFDGLTPTQREDDVFKGYPDLKRKREAAYAKADAILSLLRPAAPDAGDGEDLAGKLKAIRDKFLFPTPDKDHTDYAVMTRCIAALQPGGER